MWSWLEQLKDPIISSEDAKALSEKSVNPQNALDSLEKVAGSNVLHSTDVPERREAVVSAALSQPMRILVPSHCERIEGTTEPQHV